MSTVFYYMNKLRIEFVMHTPFKPMAIVASYIFLLFLISGIHAQPLPFFSASISSCSSANSHAEESYRLEACNTAGFKAAGNMLIDSVVAFTTLGKYDGLEFLGDNDYERHTYGLASIGANIAAYAALGATGGGLSALFGRAGTLGAIGNISLRVDRIVMGSQAAISSFKAGYQFKQGNYGGALGSLFNAAINVVGIKASPLKGASARVRNVQPDKIRFSQTTAGGNGRAAQLRESMAANGWNGPPIDTVRTSNGIVTIDNTRVIVARELGISRIPARIHNPSGVLPSSMAGRFGDARTWGEALQSRLGRQNPPLGPTGTSNVPRIPR